MSLSSRVRQSIERANVEGRAALVAYLCAGDPDIAHTSDMIVSVAEAGADIIEVGVPFSDPTADGPSIQRASERALSRGMSLRGALNAIADAREQTQVPIILFGYLNPILAFGVDRLISEAKRVSVDGFLVVDLPPDDAEFFVQPVRAAGMDFIPLVAPTTPHARALRLVKQATGFAYYVSLTGVTGASAVNLEHAAQQAAHVSKEAGVPVALGFGIKTPADVASVAKQVSAVVVGSALVDLAFNTYQQSGYSVALTRVTDFVSALSKATRR